MPNSSENEDERIPSDGDVPQLNSPESISDDILNPLPSTESFNSPRLLNTTTTTSTAEKSKTSPSPYYYSDLLAKKVDEDIYNDRKQLFAKSSKLPIPSAPPAEAIYKNVVKPPKKLITTPNQQIEESAEKTSSSPPRRYSITEEGVRIIRCETPSSTTSDDSDCSECLKRREWHSQALAIVRAATQNLRERKDVVDPEPLEPEVYYQNTVVSQMPQNRFLNHPVICACATPNFVEDDGDDQLFQPRSIFYVHQQSGGYQECTDCNLVPDDERLKALIFDEMNVRQRKLYETAFDSKIAKSDDDLDDVDRITSHTASLFGNDYRMVTSQSRDSFIAHRNEKRYRSKHSKKAQQQKDNKQCEQEEAEKQTAANELTKEIENLKVDESIDNIAVNNSNASVSNENTPYTPSPPSTAPLPLKFPTKHEKFFINSIKSAPNLPQSNNALQHPRLKDLRGSEKSDSSKERPRSVIIEAGRVFDLKRSHSGRNYSSIESMATSSSDGSMESIRSSTSEGNQSTTSTESRHSSTLSSHSSDSGPSVARPLRVATLAHPKLQVLSPISDKSAQEPTLTENNNNNINNNNNNINTSNNIDNENNTNDENVKQKKQRPAANKLLLLTRDEIQGSDSGISLHSRDDKAKLSALCDNKIDNATGLPQDLKDLPFDMPKLRRRRNQLNQVSRVS